MIRLKITKLVENPDYKESVEINRYNHCEPSQPKFAEENALAVEITEEQFEAIRKAVIEKF